MPVPDPDNNPVHLQKHIPVPDNILALLEHMHSDHRSILCHFHRNHNQTDYTNYKTRTMTLRTNIKLC